MKITIDTKEDSHEEIQKVIKMLSSLVNGKEVMSNTGDIFTDSNQTSSSDMFSDESSSNPSSSSNILSDESNSDSTNTSDSPKSSGGSMFNMFDSGSGSSSSSKNTTKEPQEENGDDEKIDLDIHGVEEYH